MASATGEEAISIISSSGLHSPLRSMISSSGSHSASRSIRSSSHRSSSSSSSSSDRQDSTLAGRNYRVFVSVAASPDTSMQNVERYLPRR